VTGSSTKSLGMAGWRVYFTLPGTSSSVSLLKTVIVAPNYPFS